MRSPEVLSPEIEQILTRIHSLCQCMRVALGDPADKAPAVDCMQFLIGELEQAAASIRYDLYLQADEAEKQPRAG